MIRRCGTWLVCLWVGCASLPVYAAQTLSIGYVQQSDDPRYDDKHITAQFLGQALGRPTVGAEVALKEVKFHGQNAGVEFALESAEAATAAELIKQVETLQAKGVHFILSDLPAPTLSEVASAFKGKDVVFFNVSAPDDSLRQAQCQAARVPHLAQSRHASRCLGAIPGRAQVERSAGVGRRSA